LKSRNSSLLFISEEAPPPSWGAFGVYAVTFGGVVYALQMRKFHTMAAGGQIAQLTMAGAELCK
jgi:hypothetical protein